MYVINIKKNIVLQNVSFPSVIFVVISKYNNSWRSYNLHLLIYVIYTTY